MPTVRLLHVSDTHLRSGVGGTSDYHPGVDPAARLDIVLEAVARAGEPADVAVHSGDITDDFSLAAASTVRDRLASAAATVIAVPGNHDDPAVVATAFGPAHAEVHGWRILGVDSTVRDEVAGSVVAAEVAAMLDAREPVPTVLVMHHPPRSRSTHPWFVLDGADALLDALAARPHVRALLTGHTHAAYDETLSGGPRLLGAPSTYYALAHDGPAMSLPESGCGARIVELHEDGSVTTSVVEA